VAPITATNAITIKDTPERIAAAAKVIAAVDKARPEVIIEVELLEVDRSRLQEFGLQLASPGSSGISGVADVNQSNLTLRNLVNLSQADVFMASLPALYYRLLKNDANTRQLANPQLRTSEGIAAQARFGELAVRVEVSSISGSSIRWPAGIRHAFDQHRDPPQNGETNMLAGLIATTNGASSAASRD
jgi:general secretion pathway protein D